MDKARGIAAVERFDSLAATRNTLKQIASDNAEWAGIPLPLEGHSMVVEKSYPFAHCFTPPQTNDESASEPTIRNRFWSTRLRAEVFIFEEGGKIGFVTIPVAHNMRLVMNTLGASAAWGIEQEHNAIQTLGTMVRHHQLKQYLLTGMFLETSQRSKLTYLFRRLRPTVVLDARDPSAKATRILAALCLHPIAYYSESWAGAMCPTDDVIAHLALMRGDEAMFWRRANQHPPHRPEAGL